MTETREVAFSTLVRAEPGRVFQAISTAEGFDSWFTDGTTIDPHPGGALVFRWKNWGVENFTGQMVGEVVEVSRPDRFIFKWPVDSGGYMTTVRIDIEPHEVGSLVRLVEGVYEPGATGTQDMLNRTGGWAQALTMMKFFVEHGVTY